jgi:hypothetical protein
MHVHPPGLRVRQKISALLKSYSAYTSTLSNLVQPSSYPKNKFIDIKKIIKLMTGSKLTKEWIIPYDLSIHQKNVFSKVICRYPAP